MSFKFLFRTKSLLVEGIRAVWEAELPELPEPSAHEQNTAPMSQRQRTIIRTIDPRSLSKKVRPDIKHTLEHRADEIGSHYHDQGKRFTSFRSVNGGANPIFHAETDSGEGYMVKPVSGAKEGHDPGSWGARNIAAHRLFDAMGASHMGVPAFMAHVPAHHEMSDKYHMLQPDENDSEEKVSRMHATHAGGPALVTGVAYGEPLRYASQEQLNKVDANHRLAGVIHHVLMGHPDGHHGNVLLDAVHGHPIHIDHDMTLASSQQGGYENHVKNRDGMPAIMSVYAPGEDLDYRKGKIKDSLTGQEHEMGDVGTNYPPDIQSTLERAASGELSNDLSPADARTLEQNAKDLLKHGLEGTLKQRHMVPTYKRAKEERQVRSDRLRKKRDLLR